MERNIPTAQPNRSRGQGMYPPPTPIAVEGKEYTRRPTQSQLRARDMWRNSKAAFTLARGRRAGRLGRGGESPKARRRLWRERRRRCMTERRHSDGLGPSNSIIGRSWSFRFDHRT
eukprot:9492663-Pyramimonas_sp.AAC.2